MDSTFQCLLLTPKKEVFRCSGQSSGILTRTNVTQEPIYSLFKKILFIYFRESMSGGRGRGRERIPICEHRAQPTVNLRTLKSRPELKSIVGHLPN